MKESRNIKKIFQTIVFTFIAFFIFGAVNVNANTVSVDRTSFLVKFSDKTSDVIQLSDNVNLSDLTTRYAIYIYKDKTIDLKGHDLIITERGIQLWYYKNATVKFIDSSNAKSGRIIREHKDGSMFADSLIGISNEDAVNATDTFLVFDGVKIYREVDNNSIKVIAPESTATDKRINKVSFINTDITNFLGLNDGREAKDFYYENVTFKRGVVNQGFLLNSSTKTVNDVISDNSEIIKESYTGTYKSTFDRNTEMSSVKTSDDVIKVRYIKGVSVSNVNFDPLNYKESPVSKNITITNSGQEDITITNVSVSSPDFVVTGSSSVTLSSGSTDNTSWNIKPKDELGGGTYVATITVTAGDKTYTSTVTLTVKELDSEGKDVVYVTTTDELTEAINARTKTIKLAKDLNYNNSWVSIPVYGDTTIDLNGKIIYTKTGNFGLNYQDATTIKIIDSSNAKTGKIVENGAGSNGASGGIIQLVNNVTDAAKECNFIIDGVNVTSEDVRSDAMIAVGGDNSLKNVKLINSLFSNYQYVLDGRSIDNITFENVKATSTEYQRIYLVGMKSGLTFGDITSDDSEVVYLEADGRYIRDASKDTLVNSDSLIKGQSIQVRYKSGFNVTAESKTINYKDSTTYYPINITNRGTSGLNITNVTIDDTNNFEVNSGNSGIIDAGKTDTSWSIKVKNGISLEKGVYTINISVLASDTITYKGTFILTVNPKPLSNLEIDGVPSEITYGDTITPTINGDDSNDLSVSDYEISYLVKEGETYVSINEPKNVGKYKAVLKVTNENYSFGEASVDFEIIPLTITPSVGIIPSIIYTGNKLTPDFNVWNGSEILIAGTDYRYTFSNNINAGKGKLTINPISGRNYTFTAFDAEFDILRKGLDSSDITITLPNTSYKYTGGEINPIPVVKDGDKELALGTDYSLSYDGDITSIGTTTAKVVVTGKGNYQNVVKVSFDIITKDSQEISFNESSITKTYGDGSFTITANHTKGDGTVKYTSTNTDVAEVNETTGLVTIKKAGNTTIKATASETEDYGEGVATYTLTVTKKEISINRAAVNSKEYDGTKTAEVNYVIFRGLLSDNLEKDVDFTATAEFDSENIGYSKPVTIKVVLKDTAKANNYTLTNNEYQTRSTINGKTIQDSWVTVEEGTYTYNGSNIEPAITVKDPTGETVLTLTKGTHYTVEYADNLNAGTGKIKVAGIGNYAGIIEKDFTINKKSITPTIENIADVTYNGREHTPLLVVKHGSTTLVKDTDYTVEYTNNLRAGNAYAEISEVSSSNYTFTPARKDFTINKYEIKASDVTLEYSSVVFDNNAKKPSVIVKMGSEVIEPIEYNVDYTNNTNVGTATVKVTIKVDSDDFTGEVTKNFEIVSKTLLTISGISNQQVTYTGNPVELVGTLQVSNGISPSSLTEKWYKDDTQVSKPKNVGVYKVVYSYEDDNYIGSLTIDFEIIKKISTVPSVNSYKGVVGDKLSTITLPNGFKWVDSNETIIAGNKEYSATYTTNNDTENYTTETVLITVYGKSKVNLNTSVNGLGGTISSSKTDILEGTTETITFTPNTGFEINKVEVNGVDKTASVANNKLDVVLGNNDVNVVVTYKVIEYTITINGVANATINPSGIIKVDYNTNKEFTIKADNGYKLVSVKVNGVERISDIVNDKLTLENILADAEIVVVVQKNLYEVIEGANQTYTITKNNEAKFRIDADYIKFENGGKVYVDDALVDQVNYTSESGSTIITLKKEFVDNLSVGDHALRVEFVDGEATTTFTVANLNEETNPKTGDNIGLYIITGIISTLGIAGTGTYIYRKKQNN